MTKLRVLQLILVTAVVAFLVVTAKPAEVWATLKQVDPLKAFLAVLLNVPIILFASARSGLVLRRMGYTVPLRVLVPTTLVGYVAGAVTPAASGELLRIEAMRRGGNVPPRDTVALVAFERTQSLYLQLVSVGALLAMISLPLALQVVVAVLALVSVVLPWVGAVVILPLLPAAGEGEAGGKLARILGYLKVVAGQVQKMYSDFVLLLQTTLATLLMFATLALQFWVLGWSIADGLNFAEAWIAYGGSTLAAIAVLVPFGLGVGDVSLAGLIHNFGFTIEQAAGVAVLVRALNTGPMVSAALACYFYMQRPAAFSKDNDASAPAQPMHVDR